MSGRVFDRVFGLRSGARGRRLGRRRSGLFSWRRGRRNALPSRNEGHVGVRLMKHVHKGGLQIIESLKLSDRRVAIPLVRRRHPGVTRDTAPENIHNMNVSRLTTTIVDHNTRDLRMLQLPLGEGECAISGCADRHPIGV